MYWSHETSGRLYTTALSEISFSSLSRVLASQVGRPGFNPREAGKGLFHHFQSVHWWLSGGMHLLTSLKAGVMGGMEITRGLPPWWLQNRALGLNKSTWEAVISPRKWDCEGKRILTRRLRRGKRRRSSAARYPRSKTQEAASL